MTARSTARISMRDAIAHFRQRRFGQSPLSRRHPSIHLDRAIARHHDAYESAKLRPLARPRRRRREPAPDDGRLRRLRERRHFQPADRHPGSPGFQRQRARAIPTAADTGTRSADSAPHQQRALRRRRARAGIRYAGVLYFNGYDVADKTGTTDDSRDAWVIGYTPSIVVGEWAGNNDNTPMVKKIAAYIVAPTWHKIMAYALSKYSSAIGYVPAARAGNRKSSACLARQLEHRIRPRHPRHPLSGCRKMIRSPARRAIRRPIRNSNTGIIRCSCGPRDKVCPLLHRFRAASRPAALRAKA